MYYECIVYVLCMYYPKTFIRGSQEVLYSLIGDGYVMDSGITLNYLWITDYFMFYIVPDMYKITKKVRGNN